MAVVQISRIQIRRGQKNTGSGLPQLAGGELAWAVDTQELYIGNGAVSEGAPYVGNTKVLTEHDNLLNLIDQYSYKDAVNIQTGSDVNYPIERTIQDRLDERVSALSFGVVGDGTTDNTAAIQRALDQLYLNAATRASAESRVVLDFPAGTFKVSSTIRIPSYTTINGAGAQKTIFAMTGSNGPVFRTVNDLSTPGVYANDASTTYNNQTKHVRLKGFTVTLDTATETAFELINVRDSVFENIEVIGSWTSLSGSNLYSVGFALTSLSSVVTCERLHFKNCRVSNQSYGVYSDYDILNCQWSECEFSNLYRGVSFGQNTDLVAAGQLYGPRQCSIKDSVFAYIDRHGIYVWTGTENLSQGNRFTRVGNDGNANTAALVPHILFNKANNASEMDISDRFKDLSESNTSNPFITDVGGHVYKTQRYVREISIGQISVPLIAFRLPYYGSMGYEIAYMYQSISNGAGAEIMRKGKLHLAVDQLNQNIQFVDEYEATGTVGYEENLQFYANLVDSNSSGGVDTINITYTNSTTSDQGKLYFSSTVIS